MILQKGVRQACSAQNAPIESGSPQKPPTDRRTQFPRQARWASVHGRRAGAPCGRQGVALRRVSYLSPSEYQQRTRLGFQRTRHRLVDEYEAWFFFHLLMTVGERIASTRAYRRFRCRLPPSPGSGFEPSANSEPPVNSSDTRHLNASSGRIARLAESASLIILRFSTLDYLIVITIQTANRH